MGVINKDTGILVRVLLKGKVVWGQNLKETQGVGEERASRETEAWSQRWKRYRVILSNGIQTRKDFLGGILTNN